MAKNRRVALIGVGETVFKTDVSDKTYVELSQDAAKAALDDAGLGPDDIDAVVFSMAPTQFVGVNDVDKWAVDSVWAAGKPFMRVHTGGATGGSALHAGYAHVASGMYRTVLVVGADRVTETPDAQLVLNLIWDLFYEHDFALNTVTMTALSTQRYMHKYGTTEEQYARVVVRSRHNALNNPYAHLKGDITIDNVMSSPRISWPYKLFDICPRSAGAAAVVLANEEVTKRHCSHPAFINGIGGLASTVFMGDRVGPYADAELSDEAEFVVAGKEAYAQAGITNPIKEIQVVELYDAFSSMQFPQLESLGFCKRGQAQELSDEGAFDMGALLSVNPSGGTLCTNPIGVTGLVRVADAALQVMGKAGEAQVSGVRNALATAVGGSVQFVNCTILGADYV
ncbi:MAG: thiolase family protein [Candidatus Acidiferrales bacterium]